MQWLTAALAFATTMLMLSVIVSSLVEVVHRIGNHRAQGMRLVLESLYDRVIQKYAPGSGVSRDDFVRWIMENRALTDEATGQPRQRGFFGNLVDRVVKSSVVTDIPVEVFTQKLADNRLVAIADQLGEHAVADIAQKYVTIGNEATQYFRARARLLSVVIAFFVAFLFHIHPYDIASAYMKSPELAQSVAERNAEAYARYEQVQKALDSTANAALSTTGSGVAGLDAQSAEQLKLAVADFSETLKDARAQAQALNDLGVPIGWPVLSPEQHSALPALGVHVIWTPSRVGEWRVPSVTELIWLAIGGLLVGLGAPFWAQAVSAFTASRDVVAKIGRIAGGESEEGRPATAVPVTVRAVVPTPAAAGPSPAAAAPPPVQMPAPTHMLALERPPVSVATFRLARHAAR